MTHHVCAWRHLLALSLFLLTAACADPAETPRPILTETSQAPTPGRTADPSQPAPTSAPAAYWVQPGVPDGLANRVLPVLTSAGWTQAAVREEAALHIVLDPGPEAAKTAEWIYVLAAPFPTVTDEVAWASFVAYWQANQPLALDGSGAAPRLMLREQTAQLLTFKLGPLSADPANATDTLPSQLVDLAWEARPSLSMVPFEELEPRWKVLSLDGQSPVEKSFDPAAYPLTFRIGLIAEGDAGAQGIALIEQSGAWPATNRDPSKLVHVVMTGVTALSRAVAMQMETQGMDFPARLIMPFFASADILHTSNEASFAPDCPEPDWYGEPVFCEQRDYYELLRTIGLDIVELTGNHNLDYGADAALNALDVYDHEGLPYFGGGRSLEDATAPRSVTTPDGTRFAFLGCNSAGPYHAWATDTSPGAAPCDDWTRIRQQITDLKTQNIADVIIVTVQYLEADRYDPTEQQVIDFEALGLAGADIVSGSQAHQPQGFSFAGSSFIHFGVGNLFFDQIDLEGNRQMFADKHVFYQGRHISTILFTGYFETIGQPRPMTPQERRTFLQTIFAASRW